MVASIYEELRATFAFATGYLAWIPTYGSGCWSLAYASNDRRHDDSFSAARAEAMSSRCKYYNAHVHKACFALPNFARDVIESRKNPFDRQDSCYSEILKAPRSGRHEDD